MGPVSCEVGHAKASAQEAPGFLNCVPANIPQVRGVGAAATGLVAPAPRATGAAILGPDAVPLPLKVNGVTHTATVEPRVTLLRALRNHLGLTGAAVRPGTSTRSART